MASVVSKEQCLVCVGSLDSANVMLLLIIVVTVV